LLPGEDGAEFDPDGFFARGAGAVADHDVVRADIAERALDHGAIDAGVEGEIAGGFDQVAGRACLL